MAMSCEQIDEQMVDFLYGELAPDARAAFEAHMGGCDRCRREVESLGHTRVLARAGQDQAPPAHLRARIVDAARAALPAAATAAAAAPVIKAPATQEPSVSLWRRLRLWWSLPTLATVGALAVFVLGSRLFLDPKNVELRGRPVASSEAPAGAPVAQDTPSFPLVAPAAPSLSESRGSVQRARGLDAPDKSKNKGGGSAAHRGASRSPAAEGGGLPQGRVAADKAEAEGPLDGLRDERAASGAGASARVAQTEKADKRSMDDDVALGGLVEERKAYAPEPMAMEPRATASASRPARIAKKSRVQAEDQMEDSDLSAPESARQPSAPLAGKGYPAPPASHAPAVPAAATAAPAPAPPPAKVAKESDKDSVVASKPKADVRGAETLVQRADRLFTEGRWVEATVAYRDLLRQNPSSPDAPRWRRRLIAADSAAATTRAAPP